MVAAERLIMPAFAQHDMQQRRRDQRIRAGFGLQEDVSESGRLRTSGIDDDQL